MSAITEALDSIRAKENQDKADRQQLVRRARKHRQSDTKGAMGWFSAPAGGLSLEGIGSRKEVIAYHGSQSADLKLSDEYSLYLTSSKDVASDFARGSAFNYRLTKDDNPTVYTMRVRLDNPLVLHSEGEYDRYMDASNNRTVIPELKDKGFDGIVYRTDRETYYEVFSPESQLVILNRQSADAMREEAGTSQAATSVSLTESKADIQSFIDKFGEDTYDTFKKSSHRLKNAGMSADMLTYVHDDSMSKDKLDRILFNLANHIKTVKSDMSKIGGKYKYLGSAKGYDVYQPLDAESSMNLGVGSGWCTTGRYGHYGEENFKPSLKDAEKHWNAYTSRGVKFFYFLQHGKGKYALALYPKILNVEEFIPGYYLKQTNFELYDAPDNLDYKDLNKLPLDLIPEKIVLDMTKLKKDDSGKLTLSEDGKILMEADTGIENANIPDGVTSIGAVAFYNCSSLKSIVIPDSVTSIGVGAFRDCSSLKSVDIPNSVTSIGEGAFQDCSSLKSVDIPDSVTSIGDYAFSWCKSLKSAVIPNSVTSIGDSAFYNCQSLESVTIPNSVTSIKNEAFYNCQSLKSVNIPDSVTSIGVGAFWSCSSLKLVNIPDSVTSIGHWAFYNCQSLKSVNIPDSVTSIGHYAFANCSSLKSITVGPKLYDQMKKEYGDIVHSSDENEESVTESMILESKADIQSFIDKFGNDTYAEFRKSVQRLKNAGMSADMLTYVRDETMSKDKLDKILFNLANHIKTVKSDMSKIGGKYKYLGSAKGYDVYQPLDAESSMNLGVGSGWCTTGRYGHYGEDNFNPSLNDAKKHWNDYTSEGVKFFYFLQHGKGKYALALYPNVLDTHTYIPGYYLKQTNVELYDAPDNLDYEDLYKLPLELVPEKIILDMEKSKKDASGKLTLSEDGKTLVRVDRDIMEAVIPDSVTSISNYTFRGCSSLKSVTIPSTVTSIGVDAFANCSSLESIVLPDSITSIGEDAFYNCSSLKSVTIPNTVTSIVESAFANCSSLESIVLPDSITSIGEYAFYWCKSLKSAVIPDSVTSISNYAFRGCSSLKSVTIPNSVTSIGMYAFSRCDSLKLVNIPDSVTSIGHYAFYGCSSLKSITVGPKLYDQLNFEYGDIVIIHDGSNGMSEAYRWHPSRTDAREFVQKMDDINDFCNENGIRMSRNGDSYYFTLNDRSYRVSNHSVEASNRGAYNSDGVKVRNLYHPGGREDDVIYINAGKTRIEQIYNDLKAGYELDGNGRRKDGTVYHSPESIAKAQAEDSYAKWEKIVTDPTGKFKLQGLGTILADVIDKNATKLVIPDGVRQFDYRVFMDCPNLDTLVIPNSATMLSARGLESIPHIILHKDAPQELKNRFIGASRHRASWIEDFHITFE